MQFTIPQLRLLIETIDAHLEQLYQRAGPFPEEGELENLREAFKLQLQAEENPY